jgi:TPR repeat protein
LLKSLSNIKTLIFVLLGVIACVLLAMALQDGTETSLQEMHSKTEDLSLSNAERSNAYAQDGRALENDYQAGTNAFRSKRYTEAEALFRKTALGGHSGAQFNLGMLYENGLGLPKDGVQACYWYRVAAQNKNADAQKALDRPSIKYKKEEGGATWETENC